MLKLCGEYIYKPLNLIFRSCLKTGQFPSEWKKANVVPVFKKGESKIIVQFLDSLSLAKFLKDYFRIKFLSFLLEMI